MRGTGPKRAPASLRNVPAWTSATRVPPPRSAAQSTASLIATSVAARGLLRRRGLARAAAIGPEVAVEGGGRRLRLALVLRAQLRAPVRPLDLARHPEEADLADLHAVVQRDRQ